MTAFDDFATTAQNVFDNACKATGELVSTSKLKLDRMNVNAEIDRCYLKLGRSYYQMSKGSEADATIQALILKIDLLLAQVEELTAQINGIL